MTDFFYTRSFYILTKNNDYDYCNRSVDICGMVVSEYRSYNNGPQKIKKDSLSLLPAKACAVEMRMKLMSLNMH